jgi:hypothetical protein
VPEPLREVSIPKGPLTRERRVLRLPSVHVSSGRWRRASGSGRRPRRPTVSRRRRRR